MFAGAIKEDVLVGRFAVAAPPVHLARAAAREVRRYVMARVLIRQQIKIIVVLLQMLIV